MSVTVSQRNEVNSSDPRKLISLVIDKLSLEVLSTDMSTD